MLDIVENNLSAARAQLELGEKAFRLIAAVSGGADSVCLVDILNRLREKLGLIVIVAHVDHGLRAESEGEAVFVKDLAARLQLPFELKKAAKRPSSENLEAWGRRVRYDFFNALLVKHQAHLVLTAHHQNDQAETVLQRFLSGRLLTDAHAIVGFDGERKICRPLLNVKRSAIDEYVVGRELSFVTDSSNLDLSFNRNKIRHELLPQLEREYNPNLIEALGRFAERFGQDELYLDSQAETSFKSLKRPVSVKALRRVKAALLWRVVRLIAEEQVGEDANKLGYQAFRKVCEFLHKEESSFHEADLGFGIRASKSGEALVFIKS